MKRNYLNVFTAIGVACCLYCHSSIALGGPLVAESELSASSVALEEALHDLRYGSTQNLNAYLDGAEFSGYQHSADDGSDEFTDYSDGSGPAGRLSPVKAAALSLVVPGAGQWYAKSHPAKIGAYLLAEGFLWMKYSKYHSDANDQIDAFEAFADAHWNEYEYRRYLGVVYGDTSDANISVHVHHLPDSKTQQYYEMIGKYDQFSYGWAMPDSIDYTINPTSYEYHPNDFVSEFRVPYNIMRGNANTLFADRDRMLAFAAVNHLVSAIDAALAAARYNREIDPTPNRLSLSPSVKPGENWSIIPYLDLSLRF